MSLHCFLQYREHGLSVAKACVAAGTDLVDISGENLDTPIVLLYKKNVYLYYEGLLFR